MNSETTFRISVDVTNPGQFFACCGLLELADRFWPGAEGWFDATAFNLRMEGTLRELLTRLVRNAPRLLDKVCGDIPVKPIIAPLELTLADDASAVLVIDFWMEVKLKNGKVQAISKPPWNFWSGQQTPLRIWLPLRCALQQILSNTTDEELFDLFSLHHPLKGRFGFDSAAAWSALDVGFSPNEQGLSVNSSPAIELLSAIGLQRFRPMVSADRSSISYATWSVPAGALVASTMACLAVFGRGIRYELPVISRGQYAALGHAQPKQGVTHE